MSRANRNRLRLVRTPVAAPEPTAPPATARKPALWPKRSAPVFPGQTHVRMRAQSALCGLQFRDGSTVAPVLTYEQACDVVAWYRPDWYRIAR